MKPHQLRALNRLNLEQLAAQPPRLTNLNPQDVDEIAHLALLIAQNEIRKAPGLILSPAELVPYQERPEAERRSLQYLTLRCLQALVLLGWIELPS